MQEENVATRLKLFMDNLGLSHSQFADRCGIPRPTLSQLLSGRNKKISDLLVGQIHRAFPELSVLWLLFGEGEMLRPKVDDSENSADSIADNSIFTPDRRTFEFDAKETDLEIGDISPTSLMNKGESIGFRADRKIGQKNEISKNPRKVIQITVYYDDSTFETFTPETKK